MIQLHNANCFDILPTIESGSVDLICTDPPYYSTNLHFDKEERLDFKAWLLECKRVLKPAGVLVAFCDLNLLIELKSHAVFKTGYELIWQKHLPVGFLDANIRPLRQHELIFVMTNQLKASCYNPQKKEGNPYIKINENIPANQYGRHRKETLKSDGDRHPTSVLSGFYDNERQNTKIAGQVLHPTQKPLDLVSWLIKTYSNENDLVIDCFAGSGTTGAACAKLRRDCILIEKHPPYFDMASQRIKDAEHDLDLMFGT